MTALTDLWRVALVVDESKAAVFEEALDGHADTVSRFAAEGQDEGDGGLWVVEGLSRHPIERPDVLSCVAAMAAALDMDMPEIEFGRLEQRDWLTLNLASFPPIRAGRFYIHGSHVTEAPPPATIALKVDAGTAFGSGEHASTKGCLLALDMLAKRGRLLNVLDVGCGSGILGLAAARLWRASVLASDIDPESMRVTKSNAQDNRAAQFLTAVTAPGYRHDATQRRAPYDLIFANILARPLMRLAKDLKQHLKPGGVAVLAGLLERQERMVLSAHLMQGLCLERRILIDGWACLVLRKRNLTGPM
ncbi:MAG: 50S ribosomal protein L11 methyltransferase [Rhodospirillales bacterium]|nr:MAG: 50S ribosomal protein L11 methyltransferase [Rhodospirillales bacterium]